MPVVSCVRLHLIESAPAHTCLEHRRCACSCIFPTPILPAETSVIICASVSKSTNKHKLTGISKRLWQNILPKDSKQPSWWRGLTAHVHDRLHDIKTQCEFPCYHDHIRRMYMSRMSASAVFKKHHQCTDQYIYSCIIMERQYKPH